MLILFFYDLPHKGFDFTDHGYYLYNNLLLAKGIIPSAGLAPIINAIFLKFGFRNYLFFERLYYVVIVLVMIIFWSSIRPISKSYLLPLAIVISIAKNPTYMINYQTAPVLFLMGGFGFLFKATRNTDKIWSSIFYIFSGMILSFSAFSNISLIPTLISTWVLILFVTKGKKYACFFHIVYFTSSIFLGLSYFLSENSIFGRTGKAYGAMSIIDILHKGSEIFWIIVMIPGVIQTSIVICLVISMFLLVLVCFPRNRGGLLFEKLDGYRSYIFLALLVIFFVTSYYVLFLCRNAYASFFLILFDKHMNLLQMILSQGWGNLVYYGVIYFCIFLMACFSFIKAKSTFIELIISSLVTTSYVIILAITTTGSPGYHITLMAPLFIAITFLLFENNETENSIRGTTKNLFVILMIFMSAIGVYFNVLFSYGSYPVFVNDVKINTGILQGIYVESEKYNLVQLMYDQYRDNDCQHKYFLAYPSLPLLYYIFDREALHNQPYLTFLFDNRMNSYALINTLKNMEHWCVMQFTNSSFDCLSTIKNHLFFLKLTDFLQSSSVDVISTKFAMENAGICHLEEYSVYVK